LKYILDVKHSFLIFKVNWAPAAIIIVTSINGIERDKQEWKKIFFEAGFKDYKVIPVLGVRSIISSYILESFVNKEQVHLWIQGDSDPDILPCEKGCVKRVHVDFWRKKKTSSKYMWPIYLETKSKGKIAKFIPELSRPAQIRP
jgi:hypothetical protein